MPLNRRETIKEYSRQLQVLLKDLDSHLLSSESAYGPISELWQLRLRLKDVFTSYDVLFSDHIQDIQSKREQAIDALHPTKLPDPA